MWQFSPIAQFEVDSRIIMTINDSLVTPEDIEKNLIDLKNEADEISGPSTISRRFVAAGSAILVLAAIYYAGKRRGEKTKTFVEIIRAE